MVFNELSKGDAVALLELIQECTAAITEEDLKSIIRRLNYLIPFKAAASGFGKCRPDGSIKTLKAVNLNYPKQYMEEYIKQNFAARDPIVAENFRYFRLQFWADTIMKRGVPQDMISVATDFGFAIANNARGYAHGVRNMSGTEGSLFSFYGLRRCRRTEVILNVIVPHIHQVMSKFIQAFIPRNLLSAKEKDIINWIKFGKSTWDISVLLGISERTVKFHIANIMKKLDASTRAHAVAIAIEQGLVEI